MARTAVLFDQTSGANAALDSNTTQPNGIDTTGYDALLIEGVPSGTAAAGTLGLYDSTPATPTMPAAPGFLYNLNTPASATPWAAGWGPGCQASAGASNYLGGIGAPLPTFVRFVLSALGAAITGRVRVIGVKLSGNTF